MSKKTDPQLEEEMLENWESLKARLGIEEPTVKFSLPQKRVYWTKKRISALCVSAVLTIGISVGAGLYFGSLYTPDQSRYCTAADYTIEDTAMTMKEFSLQNDGDILYFDWTGSLDQEGRSIYTLNTTSEIIAFKEELLHSETGYSIILCVTDNHTEIDDFSIYKNNCTNKTTVENISVKYNFYNTGYTVWEYKGYRYYMQSDGPETLEDTLALISELLQTA